MGSQDPSLDHDQQDSGQISLLSRREAAAAHAPAFDVCLICRRLIKARAPPSSRPCGRQINKSIPAQMLTAQPFAPQQAWLGEPGEGQGQSTHPCLLSELSWASDMSPSTSSWARWQQLPAVGSQACLLLEFRQNPVMAPGSPLARGALPTTACTGLGFVQQEHPGLHTAVQAAVSVTSSGCRDVGRLSWGLLWAAACQHRAGGEWDAARATWSHLNFG